MGPVAKRSEGEAERLVQLFQVTTRQVAHLDVLEVVPPFVPRIEIRGGPWLRDIQGYREPRRQWIANAVDRQRNHRGRRQARPQRSPQAERHALERTRVEAMAQLGTVFRSTRDQGQALWQGNYEFPPTWETLVEAIRARTRWKSTGLTKWWSIPSARDRSSRSSAPVMTTNRGQRSSLRRSCRATP